MARKKYSKTKRYAKRRGGRSRQNVVIIRKQKLMTQIAGSAGGIPDLFWNATYRPAFTNTTNSFDLEALAAQFESMKILKMEVALEPLINSSSSSDVSEYVRVCYDNDATSLLAGGYTTESQYLFNNDCKSYNSQGYKPIRIKVYPKTTMTETFGTTTMYKVVNPGYLNCAQITGGAAGFELIPPRIYIPASAVGAPMFNVRVTCVCAFKGSK